MYYVYVLRSEKNGSRYVGMSEDPDKRLIQHNAGYTKSTKAFRPWLKVYSESYQTLAEAVAREKYLKSGIGREFLDRLHL